MTQDGVGPRQPMPRPPRRVLVLLNRHAARGGTDIGAALAALREQGLEVTVPDVSSVEEMRHALRHVLADGPAPEAIVVGGGDGTLNALADLLVDAGRPVGVLPLGTANDLARTLGIPADPAAALSVVAAGWTMPIDLGRATWDDGRSRYYFNVASLGASVAVARVMQRRRHRNARWGVLSYPLALVEAVWAYRPFRVGVTVDGRQTRLHAYQVSVANGVYYGGGMTVAEDAAIDDGLLDVTVVKVRSPWRVLFHLPALRRGRHHRWDGVVHLRGRHVEVRPRRRMAVNTDGEITGQAPARFAVVPQALTLLVPETRARIHARRGAEQEAIMSDDGWPALRSDAEVALDDVTVGCKRTAEHLTDAAEVIADEVPSLAALFRDLAARRAALAADLERRMLEMDAYPGAPDEDRELVGVLARRLRHVLSSHDEVALLEDRLQETEDLASDIATALACTDVPEAAREALSRAGQSVAEDLARLFVARGGLENSPDEDRPIDGPQ